MKRLFSLPLLFALAQITQTAQGAQLSPVRLLVQPTQKSASLQITNNSATQSIYDVRIKSWIKMNESGQDTLEETDSIITSRPVVSIPAGQTATIRFVVAQRSENIQDNYRVIITDITPNTDQNNAAVRIRSVLPLFVSRDLNSKGKLELIGNRLSNVGTRHIRIIGYKDIHGKQVQTLRYVLPNQSMTLPISSVNDVQIDDTIN